MADISIERLYDIMKEIEENKKGGSASENAPLFNEIVQATKGDSRAKRLASQFIARLFKDFPAEQSAAYNSLVDLMEDDDVMIRKQVISDLPKLCKDVAVYAPKVADLLAQMMQTDDSMEQSLVNQALMQTLSVHPAEALTGLFDQLTHDEAADLTRERALRFLAAKLPHLSLTPPLEELLYQLSERLLYDVTQEEFGSVVQLLATLQCARTQAGRQRLVDTVCEQADLAAEFVPTDSATVARVRECARQAVPFLSRSANAKALLVYFLDKVLPVVDQVPPAAAAAEAADVDASTSPQGQGGEPSSPDVESPRLELLRCLAELSCHAGKSFVATDKQLSLLLTRLKELMPLPPPPPPPPTPSTDEADAEANAASAAADQAADLNFSHVECLLFTFHQLAKTNADFLTACPERLADFTKRLQFFNQANQVYLRSLKSSSRTAAGQQPVKKQEVEGAVAAEATAADDKATASAVAGVREAALRVTDNIGRLIRDLSRSPPAYRTEIDCLSWQQQQQKRRPPVAPGHAHEDEQRKRHHHHVGGEANNGGGGGDQGGSKRRVDRDRYGGGGGAGGSRNRRQWRGNRW